MMTENDGLYQQSPTFWAPGTSLVEGNFSTDQGSGAAGGMVQAVM